MSSTVTLLKTSAVTAIQAALEAAVAANTATASAAASTASAAASTASAAASTASTQASAASASAVVALAAQVSPWASFPQTITSGSTIQAGCNALLVGTVTNSGTLTVPAGSTLMIL